MRLGDLASRSRCCSWVTRRELEEVAKFVYKILEDAIRLRHSGGCPFHFDIGACRLATTISISRFRSYV